MQHRDDITGHFYKSLYDMYVFCVHSITIDKEQTCIFYFAFFWLGTFLANVLYQLCTKINPLAIGSVFSRKSSSPYNCFHTIKLTTYKMMGSKLTSPKYMQS